MKKTRLATVLYVLGILVAGFANAAAKLITKEYNAGADLPLIAPAFSTLLFCVNLLLYLFLMTCIRIEDEGKNRRRRSGQRYHHPRRYRYPAPSGRAADQRLYRQDVQRVPCISPALSADNV